MDLSLLRLKEGEREKHKMVKEERSSSRSGISAIQDSSSAGSAETLTFLKSDDTIYLLR